MSARKTRPATRPKRIPGPTARRTKRPKRVTPSSPLAAAEKDFLVVGIGASAGGLEALEGFFDRMPSDAGMAFVIVQHLDPAHKSIMGSLLEKHTRMEVLEAKDGVLLTPNRVYLNPPRTNLGMLHGRLCLMDRSGARAPQLPIDYFFSSLAEDCSNRTVAIILSGTGSDGTLGLRDVKAKGGLAMVQEEAQAKYDGMPRSAINTGLVDYVLPVEQMPERLLKYARHPYANISPMPDSSEHAPAESISKILLLIRTQTGHDFSNYKQSTIRRRIERRMAVQDIAARRDYLRYLERTPAEVAALHKDLLIGVTSFFRDPEAFTAFQDNILPQLITRQSPRSALRVWAPGCSTGEEAYSIAMVIADAMAKTGPRCGVQLFATDIDAGAIEFARTGAYPPNIAADVPGAFLERYFLREEGVFRVSKPIREMVIFAAHSLVKDPPFSKMDFVSCRNVLIYMDQVLQKRIVPLFHYALKPEGFLMLGPSESIGEFSDLFSAVDTKWKIFRPRENVVARPVKYDRASDAAASGNPHKREAVPMEHRITVRELAEHAIIEEYGPPCVVVNDRFDILHFHGKTDRFLCTPVGEPTFSVLKLAREELRAKLSVALQKAVKEKRPIVCDSLIIPQGAETVPVRLVVRPLLEPAEMEGLVLIVFETPSESAKAVPKPAKTRAGKKADAQVAALEHELAATKEYLQTTVEELETANEELRSTNEELQSANEELQSTNEELETAREELQSTNEELETVNAELQGKLDEFARANDDLNNLLAATEIGSLFLDTQLCIRRFTPSVSAVVNLKKADEGRPLTDITSRLLYDTIYEDVEQVLATLVRKESEVRSTDGRWFSIRILPYRTLANVIDGVVLTFVDITRIKQADEARQLAVVVRDSNDAIILIGFDGHILAWNRGAGRMYGYTEQDALKMRIDALVPESKREELRVLMDAVRSGETVSSLETQRVAKDGRILDIWLTASVVAGDETSSETYVATTERDITERKRREGEHERNIAALREELRQLKQAGKKT